MIDLKIQPKNIISKDHVIVINEEKEFEELIGMSFVVGKISTRQNFRNYQMLYFNGNNVIIEGKQYWVRREFIEVVSRNDKDGITYYKVYYKQNEKDKEQEREEIDRLELFFFTLSSIVRKILGGWW